MSNTPNTIQLEDIRRPYHHFKATSSAETHYFYISEGIGDPEQYVDMIHTIKHASQYELVYIYLNTGGGQIRTGIQIINAMRNSHAKIITVLESEAHSLGTMIFLAGDEYIVHDNCRMMFHNFSGGVIGKGNEQVSELTSTVEWFSDLVADLYIPFLTEDEVQRMCKGEDFWMVSEEIRERLQSMVEIMEEERGDPSKLEADELRRQAQILMEEAEKLYPDDESEPAVLLEEEVEISEIITTEDAPDTIKRKKKKT